MQLQGSHVVDAPIERTFALLNDPAVLQRCIQGCEKMERIGDDDYRAQLKVGLAAMKGTFAGKIRVADKQPPSHYTLQLEGNGPLGFLKGSARIALQENAGKTTVNYTTDAQVGGMIAAVGSRLIEAAAKSFAADFFRRFGQAAGEAT